MTALIDQSLGAGTHELDHERAPLERANSGALARVRFDLSWRSAMAHHVDSYVVSRLDLRRDSLPPGLEPLVLDQPVGHHAGRRFAVGELIDGPRDSDRPTLRPAQFNRALNGRAPIHPRTGRFYPKRILSGVPGIVAADRTAFRVLGSDERLLLVDLAHPLANKPLDLALTIDAAWTEREQPGERCTDVVELLTANGPGMQGRADGRPTDFWSDLPFARLDPRPDSTFYGQPRFVDHIDHYAIAAISALYGRLIAGTIGNTPLRVLDLMASWHSHLPAVISDAAEVTGLGMSQAELDANPVLAGRVVHDLNQEPRLPFPNAAFDAVICTVSVEYLIEPFAVLRDIARVLRPGGTIIITFSNRWFPPKAIAIWGTLHEFERPGLVLEYLSESGLYADLNTWSLRGLPRPADDKYADRLRLSDPVHAVWATRGPYSGEKGAH
jgi:SAM-dependent methyltransferase